VDTHEPVCTIADLSDVWVVAAVPEKDVEIVRKDQTVEIIAAAYPHAMFYGTITYIGDVLEAATRTLPVRVTAPNPEGRLKPEMFALVRVSATPDPDLLTVPLEAVQSLSSSHVVFVRRSPVEFEIRTVRIGGEYDDVVTVLSGLKAGESVVTKGSFLLKSEMERHKIEPAP
jgi:cobalt-zinc-cadmium efflux system membrane fusion protein